MTNGFGIKTIFAAVLLLMGTPVGVFGQDPNAKTADPNLIPTIQSEDTVDKPSDEADGYDRYRLIYQQNMFARNRRAVRQQFEKSPEMVNKQVVLSLYVLRGVAVQGNQRTAFIEDIVSGRTLKGQVGTELLGGVITEVRINSVVFRQSEQDREILIGGEFGKTESETQVTAETAEIRTETAEPPPAEDITATDEEELLKQMMERRNRELGR